MDDVAAGKPHDFVIAAGQQYAVGEFIDWSTKALGITLEFKGKGIEEVGTVVAVDGDKAPSIEVGQDRIKIDERYFRPAEVETLLDDPIKRKNAGWEPEITVQEMCAEMIEADYLIALNQLKLDS